MSEDDLGLDPNRKRASLPPPDSGVDMNGKGRVGDILTVFESNGQLPQTVPPSPPMKRDPKRTKTGLPEGENEVTGVKVNTSGSAGSQEEYRREQ
jgi:hypothetical protein